MRIIDDVRDAFWFGLFGITLVASFAVPATHAEVKRLLASVLKRFI